MNADTLLYIDSLLPNQQYIFQATIQPSSHTGEVKSNVLNVTTMDTTSHNFTWQTFTFGEHSSSVLRDVAIINPDNIWAVGEIYMNDSLGNPDPNAYNAVHWDGNEWELKRINMLSNCNPVIYPPLRAIWAFSENNIVVTSGGSIGWFNGATNRTDCSIRPLLTGSINKIWGSSSEDLYVVGNNGNIVWYNGSQWTKIESGTEFNIIDIWGDINSFTGEKEIICGAVNVSGNIGSDIIRIKEDLTTEKLNQTGLEQIYSPLWFKSGKRYYIVGDGLYEKTYNSTVWVNLNEDKIITQYFMESVRGTGVNDVMVVGDFGECLHYNGISWESFVNRTSLSNGAYFRVDIEENIIVAVGLNQIKGIILVGNHQ